MTVNANFLPSGNRVYLKRAVAFAVAPRHPPISEVAGDGLLVGRVSSQHVKIGRQAQIAASPEQRLDDGRARAAEDRVRVQRCRGLLRTTKDGDADARARGEYDMSEIVAMRIPLSRASPPARGHLTTASPTSAPFDVTCTNRYSPARP